MQWRTGIALLSLAGPTLCTASPMGATAYDFELIYEVSAGTLSQALQTSPVLNDAGTVAFTLDTIVAGTSLQRVLRGNAAGLEVVVETRPSTPGAIFRLRDSSIGDFNLSINGSGDVAVVGRQRRDDLFPVDEGTALVVNDQIAALPTEQFTRFRSRPVITDSGAVYALMEGPSPGFFEDDGELFPIAPQNELLVRIDGGAFTPLADSDVVGDFESPALVANDAGDVYYVSDDGAGNAIRDATGNVVFREGGALPGGVTLDDIEKHALSVNADGLLVFPARTPTNASGLFSYDGSSLGVILEPSPERFVGSAAVNAEGDVAFLAADRTRFVDSLGVVAGGALHTVLSEGDALFGSTVRSFDFDLSSAAFNAAGQIVHQAFLEDGRSVVFLATPADPTEAVWISPAGGFFAAGDNWESGEVPGPGNTAVFDQPGEYEVEFVSGDFVDVDRIEVRSGEPVFSGGGLNVQTAAVAPGAGDVAALTLLDMDVQSSAGVVVGGGAGAQGQMVLAGTTRWRDVSPLTTVLGDGGDGELVISENAQYEFATLHAGTSATGQGTVLVLGEDAGLAGGNLTLGVVGGGEIQILDGARSGGGLVVLGREAGSAGRAEVRGVGVDDALRRSHWELTSSIVVGDAGAGTLFVEDGGELLSAGGTIGVRNAAGGATGVATVRGTDGNVGSRWQIDNDLIVGQESGDGRLSVLDGATVRARNVDIGFRREARGAVLVDGFDTDFEGNEPINSELVVHDALVVGNEGYGELQVDGGGSVVARNVTLGRSFETTAQGLVLVRGGDEFDAPSTLAVSELLIVGENGIGSLTVDSGGRVESERGIIGRQLGHPASAGAVVVRGSGEDGRRSTFALADTLLVGDRSGSASLEVLDGGLVTAETVALAANAQGPLTAAARVAGMSDESAAELVVRELFVGAAGSARLEIADGGGVVVGSIGGAAAPGAAAEVLPALTVGAERTANVLGSGTLVVRGRGGGGPASHASDLTVFGLAVVGDAGEGRLLVDAGGEASLDVLIAGNRADGRGNVTVVGRDAGSGVSSSLDVAGEAVFGRAGGAELFVGAGGQLRSGASLLASEAGSRALATVSGLGTSWLAGSTLVVGGAGEATLTVEDRATVEVAGDLVLGDERGGVGRLLANGSPGDGIAVGVAAQGRAVVGGDGAGRAELNHDGFLRASVIEVTDTGVVHGDGGFLDAPLVINNGFIAPGLSPGVLTVTGHYEQGPDGALHIEIAGAGAGQYDVLEVLGDASIAGEVIFELIDGFLPDRNDSFAFLQVAGLLDVSAATFRFLDSGPVVGFDLSFGSGGGRLIVSAVAASVAEPGGLGAVLLLAVGSMLRRGTNRDGKRAA